MKLTLLLSLLLTFTSLKAENICQQMSSADSEGEEVRVLGDAQVLTQEIWYQTDVILNFSYKECLSAVRQEVIEFKGKTYYRFRTMEDSCDGGNTYGAIYSEDLKTPIAHIYDGDIYCDGDWNEEERYQTNKCNIQAMKLAEKKMLDFGLSFTANHARIQVRDPYIYNFIHVEGEVVKDGQKKQMSLEVLVQLESCKFGSVRISNLPL